ncbi:unnamed protein product [Rhizophagus irregularis]|nr:unnamed protein product [Rhizophagus irregularis]
MEFIDALPIGQQNNFSIESHPQTCYRSRLFDFTSKKLNEILESEDLQIISDDEILENVVSDDLNSYRIDI